MRNVYIRSSISLDEVALLLIWLKPVSNTNLISVAGERKCKVCEGVDRGNSFQYHLSAIENRCTRKKYNERDELVGQNRRRRIVGARSDIYLPRLRREVQQQSKWLLCVGLDLH